jgi:hypothetical protein
MISIFEVNSENVSVLIGSTQVSVAEMKRGGRDKRFGLVNHEGVETGHLVFLFADAGAKQAAPLTIQLSQDGDQAVSVPISPAAKATETSPTFPATGALRPRSPPPPSPDFLSVGSQSPDHEGVSSRLRTRIRELEEQCRGADEARARANREIKWRKELVDERSKLLAKIDDLEGQLRGEESLRLTAQADAREAEGKVVTLQQELRVAARAKAEAVAAARVPSPRTVEASAQQLREAEDRAAGAEALVSELREAAGRHEKAHKALEMSLHASQLKVQEHQKRIASLEAELGRERSRADTAEATSEEIATKASEGEARMRALARAVSQGFHRAIERHLATVSSPGRTDPACTVPRAVLDGEWMTWDASLIAAAVEAVVSASRSRGPESPAVGSLEDLHAMELRVAEQTAEHARVVEDKNRLIREWEQYAEHWEKRGREAERAVKQWEAVAEAAQRQASTAERRLQQADERSPVWDDGAASESHRHMQGAQRVSSEFLTARSSSLINSEPEARMVMDPSTRLPSSSTRPLRVGPGRAAPAVPPQPPTELPPPDAVRLALSRSPASAMTRRTPADTGLHAAQGVYSSALRDGYFTR